MQCPGCEKRLKKNEIVRIPLEILLSDEDGDTLDDWELTQEQREHGYFLTACCSCGCCDDLPYTSQDSKYEMVKI